MYWDLSKENNRVLVTIFLLAAYPRNFMDIETHLLLSGRWKGTRYFHLSHRVSYYPIVLEARFAAFLFAKATVAEMIDIAENILSGAGDLRERKLARPDDSICQDLKVHDVLFAMESMSLPQLTTWILC